MGEPPIAAAEDNENGKRFAARLKPCPSTLLTELFRANPMRLRRTTWHENDVGALLAAPEGTPMACPYITRWPCLVG
ncbi:MAG: hypothetical protein ACRD18_15195, partial [Terriglobia bacterium]